MLPSLCEEHEILRNSIMEFVKREVTPNVTAWEKVGEIPREIFKALGEMGCLGVRFKADHGGLEQDFWYTGIILEELMQCGSIGVAVAIMTHAEFATRLIDLAGSEDLRARIMPGAITGDLVGALGVSEPDAGSDVAALRTKAVRDGDDYIINGSKIFITNGTISDYITTAVRTGGPGHGGISLIVVPADTQGLTRRRLQKIGTHASDTAELTYEDVRVPATNLVGEEGMGFQLIMQGFEGERLVLALMANAHMRLMYGEAKRYSQERKIFGQTLSGFQVWQHRLADVLTKLHASEALTEKALRMYIAGEPANAEVSMAKLFATETAKAAAQECAQIWGGMSHMEECLQARLYRDSMALTIGAGASEVMRTIIAKSCGLMPERK